MDLLLSLCVVLIFRQFCDNIFFIRVLPCVPQFNVIFFPPGLTTFRFLFFFVCVLSFWLAMCCSPALCSVAIRFLCVSALTDTSLQLKTKVKQAILIGAEKIVKRNNTKVKWGAIVLIKESVR